MKPHKRNGKAARQRRQVQAQSRERFADILFRGAMPTHEEKLIIEIFAEAEECSECGGMKLIRWDCQTPHCKALRQEESVFYDSVSEDGITVRGATMISGVDY